MASFLITAPESMGFLAGSTLEAGVVNGLDENESRSDYDENSTSYYVGATIATPITGLRFGGAFDYLDVHNMSGETYALAGYASFQATRSEEHTSELQSHLNLVCRLLLEKKKL